MNSRERYLAACRRQPTDAPPGWVMRQAGRYLPEYRALREGKTFLDMVHDPAVAAELTCQPLRRFDMDAAILFSDILVPPAAIGQGVRFEPGRGPVIEPPLRSAEDIDRLNDFDAAQSTGFVAEAARQVRAEIGPEKALIGFCGGPFTTASYMIEGGGSRTFEHTKRLYLTEPAAFDRLLGRLASNLVPYLLRQLDAGADAVQIFESWGGALDAKTYASVVLPHVARMVAGVRDAAPEAPVIFYVNGGGHLLETLVRAEPNVLGLDWRIDPAEDVRLVGADGALQGNLDPCTLVAGPERVRAETEAVLDAFSGQQGYVFNLGSGILPTVPVESMSAVFAALDARRPSA